MTLNLIDTTSVTRALSSAASENLISQYFRVENFGFLKLSSSEQFPQTWYPTPSDIVPAGWFSLDIHNTAIGDFNGDGLLDIELQPMLFQHVVPHQTLIQPIFLIQDGRGGFKNPSSIIDASNFPVKHFLYRLGVADFNLDGISDTAMSAMGSINRNSGTNQTDFQTPVVVYGSVKNQFNWVDSYGNFSVQNLATKTQGYTFGHSIAIGDFNGDHYPDWFSNWYAFYNNRTGGFNATVTLPNGSAAISSSPSNPTNLFSDQWFWPLVNSSAGADFDEDGYDDLIYSTMPNVGNTNFNGGDLVLIKGSANGLVGSHATQINRSNDIPGNIGTNFMVAADLNGDGHKDLVFMEHYWTTDAGNSQAYYSMAKLRIFLGDGKGGLVERAGMINDPYAGHRSGEGDIKALDLNGDGWLDIVLTGYPVNLTDAWNAGSKIKDYSTIFLNNRGSLQYLDPSNLAFVQSYQFSGEESNKAFQSNGVSKLVPVDIGADGMMDFVGFVQTPLHQWPQVEQQYTYAYVSRAIKPLGRDQANESLLGTANDDKIFGYDGNDRINGVRGNDTINGGAGIDIAIYSGTASQYQITTGTQAAVVDKTTGRDGTDTLTNVERLKFTDTNVALDVGPTQNAGSVYMLYKAAFNRPSDAGGMGYWLAQKDSGKDIVTNLAQGFVASKEFTDKYGTNPTNASYVDKLYQNVLGRAGESGGVAYWNQELDAGRISKAAVLVQFATLPEGASLVANEISSGIIYQDWVG